MAHDTTTLPTPLPGSGGQVVDLTGTRAKGLGERPAASLSPSRAGDFMTCPLLYRFRSVDRLPEPPGVEAARGTLVHLVLERLFDSPAGARTPETALSLVEPAWRSIIAEQPELPGLLFGPDDAWQKWLATAEPGPTDESGQQRFLSDAGRFLDRYFALEDPTRLEPAQRELSVTAELPSGLVLRGIIDRVDQAPTGAIRVVDYKTGRSPSPGWEAKALFQMRFYGLILWRLHGRVPDRLQLLYLGNQERLSIDPSEAELRATEAKVTALWAAIERAGQTGHWPASPSKLCNWCAFQHLCPEFGGTPPPANGP
ncbi:MAG: PD-(D/E)XK nuclease family protein [Candidatus Nanopelagicales bacterium]